MKAKIQSIHFTADKKLTDFLQKKVDKLETFFDRITGAEVYLRLNNEGVENKTVEIKIGVPRKKLFAKEQATSFEEAANKAAESLQSQLKKLKTQLKNGRA
jgi:putative sigma-54 modulation protein